MEATAIGATIKRWLDAGVNVSPQEMNKLVQDFKTEMNTRSQEMRSKTAAQEMKYSAESMGFSTEGMFMEAPGSIPLPGGSPGDTMRQPGSDILTEEGKKKHAELMQKSSAYRHRFRNRLGQNEQYQNDFNAARNLNQSTEAFQKVADQDLKNKQKLQQDHFARMDRHEEYLKRQILAAEAGTEAHQKYTEALDRLYESGGLGLPQHQVAP